MRYYFACESIERVCKEATERGKEATERPPVGRRKLLSSKKVPVAPEGIAVMEANPIDKEQGIKIVFLTMANFELIKALSKQERRVGRWVMVVYEEKRWEHTAE